MKPNYWNSDISNAPRSDVILARTTPYGNNWAAYRVLKYSGTLNTWFLAGSGKAIPDSEITHWTKIYPPEEVL